jgi:hypothetical protein
MFIRDFGSIFNLFLVYPWIVIHDGFVVVTATPTVTGLQSSK